MHQEVVRRITKAEDALAREREAERAALVAQIPELWAASAGWFHPESGVEGISLVTLVGGFREFSDYLAEHGHADMAIINFFTMMPDEHELDEKEHIQGDALLRNLVDWTVEVRDYIAGKDLMNHLIAHLAAWFDTEKLNFGPEHMQRKAYRKLFHECDRYDEGNVDQELLMNLMTKFAETDSLGSQEAKENYTHHLQAWLPQGMLAMPSDTDTAAPDQDSLFQELVEQKSRPVSAPVTAEADAAMGAESQRSREQRLSIVLTLDTFRDRFIATVDIGKFQDLCLDVLGPIPSEILWVDFQTHILDGFEAKRHELDEAYKLRIQTLDREAKLGNLMERLDIDCSGFIEEDELALLLEHWKEVPKGKAMAQAMRVLTEAGPEDETGILRLGKTRFVNVMMNTYFAELTQPHFERDIKKLDRLMDRILPDHERFVSRKRALEALDRIAGDSFCEARPIYSKAFEIIREDAANFSDLSYVSAHVADATVHGGEVISLQPTAATDEDITAVEGQVINRSEHEAVSFGVVKSGVGVHIDSIAAAKGVKMYKGPLPAGVDGAVCVQPLVDNRNLRVQHGIMGTMNVDNVSLDRDATQPNFKPHQVKFYQGIATHISDALRLVRIRNELKRVAHQSISWIRRIDPKALANVCWYLVNQGKKRDTSSLHIRKFPLVKRNVTGRPPTQSGIAGNTVKRDRASKYLFRSAELKDVTSFKQKESTFISFPVAHNSVVIMLAVVEVRGKKMAPATERDVRKLVNSMEQVYSLLQQGDITPNQGAVEPANCQWHKSKLDIDALSRNKIYFLRFRLIELRRDAMKTFKMLFHNLSSTNAPTNIVLKVIQNVILAFTGETKRKESKEWAGCRRYINTDLKRAVCEYDPTRDAYKSILQSIEKDLKSITRADVAAESQPLVMMLYDWLCICVAMSKRATLLRGANTGRPISREKDITDDVDFVDTVDDTDASKVPAEVLVATESADDAGGDTAAIETAAPDAEGEANPTDATQPAADDAAATPPAADDATATPPAAEDTAATPPAADDATATPPAADDATATPPAADDTAATPPAADDATATSPAADDTVSALPVAENATAAEAGEDGPKSSMEKMFEKLDADGSGTITGAEIEKVAAAEGGIVNGMTTTPAKEE